MSAKDLLLLPLEVFPDMMPPGPEELAQLRRTQRQQALLLKLLKGPKAPRSEGDDESLSALLTLQSALLLQKKVESLQKRLLEQQLRRFKFMVASGCASWTEAASLVLTPIEVLRVFARVVELAVRTQLPSLCLLVYWSAWLLFLSPLSPS